MEIDRKMILKGGVFLAIGIWVIPMFVNVSDGISEIIRFLAIMLMAISVLYFVAFDQINKLFKKKDSLASKIKNSNLTPQQAFELQKKELENQLEIEKQKFQIAKQKAEIAKMQQQTKQQSSSGSTKMPDVLGNIGGVITGEQSNKKEEKKDNLNNIKDLF